MQLAHQQSLWSSGMAAATESTTTHANTSDTNDGFFGRPVKLATYAWNTNTPLFHSFNPWAAFCEDPRNINRLAHFKNLRMNLHVQFLINGNPFYYGRAIASYIPLPDSDDYSSSASSGVMNELQLVPSSQRPHVYLDPCKSEGGEIVCPFIFPKTYMDIPTSEWVKMGRIVIQDINNLQHANEQGDSVDITVFAYASEVSLNTPTCQIPSTLVPQGNDEYGKISYPAHLVANWAGRLANAPVIGAYARATEMIASATAGVASMFGYSRANVPTEDVCTSRLFLSHATTNERDDALSLAVDAKREVTIDPRVTGVSPEDEMALVPLAMRESYFGQFPWNTDHVPDEHLCSIRVNPMIQLRETLSNRHAFTPMAFVAHPFKYWKGSIIIRLQVVCSAYHRGRLRVVWDPDHCNANCAEMFNTNYSMLLDITESQDITFKIGWGANTDYLPVPDPREFFTYQFANFTDNLVGSNGTLSVYVVNGLTCPGSISTPISVNMFACAADDFEVAVPCDLALSALKADNTVGPPDPPTEGPGSTPDPPTANDLIVPKEYFSLGTIWDPTLDGNQLQATNYNNKTQALWVKSGPRTYKLPAWGGGTNSVTSGDFSFTFHNHEALAKDITVTIGAQSSTDTLANAIGAEVTITVTDVPLVAGKQDLDVQIEVSTGRVLLDEVTSYYPQSYIRVAQDANNFFNRIIEPNASIGSNGSYPIIVNTVDSPQTLTWQAPTNIAAETRISVSSPFGMSFNGIDNPRNGSDINNASYNTSLPDGSFQAAVTQGTSTNWQAQIFWGVWWLDESLPVPEGQNKRSHTEMEESVDQFAQYLEAIARAESEDLEDIENVLPDEPRPQGNCLKYLNINHQSDQEEIESMIQEIENVNLYISSPSESENENELLPQGDDTPEERNDDKDDANAPEHETVDLTMGPSSDVPGLSSIYFGEQITSWRQLLKRYHGKFEVVNLTSNAAYSIDMAIPPNQQVGFANSTDFQYRIYNHLIDYVSPAYICQRGSVKFRTTNEYQVAEPVIWMTRFCYLAGRVFEPFSGVPAYLTRNVISGTQLLCGKLSNVPAVEAPWYSRYRFFHSRDSSEENPSDFNERDCLRITMRSNGNIGSIYVSMAAAEDYSLSGFLSVPIMAQV